MTFGITRFQYFLEQLKQIINASAVNEKPAWYLHTNDARTKAFMLQGLARVYRKLHNKTKFEKLLEHFKLLEDGIGKIDYYDNYAKDFLSDEIMPATLRIELEKKRDEAIEELNEILIGKKWIKDVKNRINKTENHLEEMDWLSEEKEIAAIKTFYQGQIAKVGELYEEMNKKFTLVEEHVHEMRRKLRWLSIYPQALRGLFVYHEEHFEAALPFITEAEKTSKYNILPVDEAVTSKIELNKDCFYALSFVIAKLGKLKDKGLRVFATAEAYKSTQFCDDSKAMQMALMLNKMPPNGLDLILEEANAICTPFFDQNILQNLLPKYNQTF
jgi:hypothetical protein